MAVLSDVPGVEVTVVIDGETAGEYNDPNAQDTGQVDDVPTSRKFIESKPGATFKIVFGLSEGCAKFFTTNEQSALRFKVLVDGLSVRNFPHTNRTALEEIEIAGTLKPSNISGFQRHQSFHFAEIQKSKLVTINWFAVDFD
jgi:hypothetical protein